MELQSDVSRRGWTSVSCESCASTKKLQNSSVSTTFPLTEPTNLRSIAQLGPNNSHATLRYTTGKHSRSSFSLRKFKKLQISQPIRLRYLRTQNGGIGALIPNLRYPFVPQSIALHFHPQATSPCSGHSELTAFGTCIFLSQVEGTPMLMCSMQRERHDSNQQRAMAFR